MSQFPEELLLAQGSEQGRGRTSFGARTRACCWLWSWPGGPGEDSRVLGRAGVKGRPAPRQRHYGSLGGGLTQQEVWAETKWLTHPLREVCLHCPRRVDRGVWEMLPLPSREDQEPGGAEHVMCPEGC